MVVYLLLILFDFCVFAVVIVDNLLCHGRCTVYYSPLTNITVRNVKVRAKSVNAVVP
jgi:hypothetical protein